MPDKDPKPLSQDPHAQIEQAGEHSLAVERVSGFSDAELLDLCEATDAAIIEGGEVELPEWMRVLTERRPVLRSV